MLICLIFVGLLIAGLIVGLREGDLLHPLFLIAALCVVIVGVCVLVAQLDGPNQVLAYQEVELALEATKGNDIQRQAVIEQAIKDNIVIQKTNYWYHNLFINWFFSKKVVELPLHKYQ